jgi:hypothetical protein
MIGAQQTLRWEHKFFRHHAHVHNITSYTSWVSVLNMKGSKQSHTTMHLNLSIYYILKAQYGIILTVKVYNLWLEFNDNSVTLFESLGLTRLDRYAERQTKLWIWFECQKKKVTRIEPIRVSQKRWSPPLHHVFKKRDGSCSFLSFLAF